MTALRKVGPGSPPYHWHIFSTHLFIALPRLRLPRIRLKRLKHPHILLGIFFLILLIALLFALPASAGNQTPYLNFQNSQPTGAVIGTGGMSPYTPNPDNIPPATRK